MSGNKWIEKILCCVDERRRKQLAKSRHVLGLFVLITVVFIWVGSSNLMQYIFIDSNYDKPFFLTYFSTSLFSTYLLGFAFKPSWRSLPFKRTNQTQHSSINREVHQTDPDENQTKSETNNEESEYTGLIRQESKSEEEEEEEEDKLSLYEVIKLSAMFSPLWFGANFSFNTSLTLTSVSSNTILSTTSGLFTLILGAIFGIEKFSFAKLVAVLLSFGGVSLVSIADKNQGKDSIMGDVLAIVGAILYACYSTLLKKKIKSEKKLSMAMFFGFLGLINIVLFFPILVIINFAGFEKFLLPPRTVLLYLFINGMIGTVVSDYLWLLSVLLTSPLIATLGLSLTTVLAMMVDFFFKHKEFSTLYLFGATGILCGFLVVNTDEYIKFDEKIKQIFGKGKTDYEEEKSNK